MQPRLRTTVLGDSDSQQSQLKKEPGNSADRAWEQCHSSGGNRDP